MLFKNRKLYKQGNPQANFLLVLIPTVICNDLNLTKDTLVDINYDGKKIVIQRSKSND